jgi:hypothetical protein
MVLLDLYLDLDFLRVLVAYMTSRSWEEPLFDLGSLCFLVLDTIVLFQDFEQGGMGRFVGGFFAPKLALFLNLWLAHAPLHCRK